VDSITILKRYDGLAEALGGDPTPGIGFGSGMERIVMLLKEQGLAVPDISGPQVVLAYHGQPAKSQCLRLLNDLRDAGVRATMGFDDRSLKAQLRGANRTGAAFALVLGEQEMAAGQVVLQDMLRDSPREAISQTDVVRTLLARLGMDAACKA
jgi:histidyl-tRNA synthetase